MYVADKKLEIEFFKNPVFRNDTHEFAIAVALRCKNATRLQHAVNLFAIRIVSATNTGWKRFWGLRDKQADHLCHGIGSTR
jgi:hypothetical protein